MLEWQTARLRALAVGPAAGWVVQVRPELVVEIAFDGLRRASATRVASPSASRG